MRFTTLGVELITPLAICGTFIGKEICPKGRVPNAEEVVCVGLVCPCGPDSSMENVGFGFGSFIGLATLTVTGRFGAIATGGATDVVRFETTAYAIVVRLPAVLTFVGYAGVAKSDGKGAEVQGITETISRTAGCLGITRGVAGSSPRPA